MYTLWYSQLSYKGEKQGSRTLHRLPKGLMVPAAGLHDHRSLLWQSAGKQKATPRANPQHYPGKAAWKTLPIVDFLSHPEPLLGH